MVEVLVAILPAVVAFPYLVVLDNPLILVDTVFEFPVIVLDIQVNTIRELFALQILAMGQELHQFPCMHPLKTLSLL